MAALLHSERFWRERFTRKAQEEMPQLLAHSAVVSLRCEQLAAQQGLSDEEISLAAVAGLWHDAGKLPSLARSGFHPLDGAWAVRHLGEERLAGLIACHSGAEHEAELARIPLVPFDREHSLVADILDWCDLTTGPDGRILSYEERMADIEARYGRDSAQMRAQLAFAPQVAEIRARLGV